MGIRSAVHVTAAYKLQRVVDDFLPQLFRRIHLNNLCRFHHRRRCLNRIQISFHVSGFDFHPAVVRQFQDRISLSVFRLPDDLRFRMRLLI